MKEVVVGISLQRARRKGGREIWPCMNRCQKNEFYNFSRPLKWFAFDRPGKLGGKWHQTNNPSVFVPWVPYNQTIRFGQHLIQMSDTILDFPPGSH
jgi:hypothetical protein